MARLMFRCQRCQCLVSAGVPAVRIVLDQRDKRYPHRSRANVVWMKSQDGGRTKKEYRDDPGGAGREIVREALVCPQCANR